MAGVVQAVVFALAAVMLLVCLFAPRARARAAGARSRAPATIRVSVGQVAARDELELERALSRLLSADEPAIEGAQQVDLQLAEDEDPLQLLDERLGPLPLLPVHVPHHDPSPEDDGEVWNHYPAFAAVAVLHADLGDLIERLGAAQARAPEPPLPEAARRLIEPLWRAALAAHSSGHSLLVLAPTHDPWP